MDRFNNTFFSKNSSRNKEIAEAISSVYQHRNTQIPFIVYNMNYWLDGENHEVIPEDYFDDPAVMTQFQVDRMKGHMEKFEKKLALMLCDFTPLEIEKYYTGLFEELKSEGTILASYVSAGYALHNGRYKTTDRNVEEMSSEVYKTFTGLKT